MARRVKVDMTGVESISTCAEGEHIARLKSIEEKESQSGTDMLVAVFEVTKGSSRGSNIYENFPLTEKALWKLKTYLQAIGQKADGKLSIDLDKLIGKTCIISVAHTEFNGTTRAKIAEFKKLQSATPDDVDEDDIDDIADDIEDDDDPAPMPSQRNKRQAKPTPRGKAKVEDDEEDEDEDEEPTPPPKKANTKKAPAKKEPEPKADDDEDDWEDDWEDD